MIGNNIKIIITTTTYLKGFRELKMSAQAGIVKALHASTDTIINIKAYVIGRPVLVLTATEMWIAIFE